MNELGLSKKFLRKLENIDVSEITEPIQLQNAILILKLNDKKNTNVLNVEEELRELIKFETNKQLNTIFHNLF